MFCVVTVKSTVDILQNFVAFSEYMNFKVNSDLEYLFWQRKNSSESSDLKPPLVTVKSTMEISQNFVAFSEYMNFNK